MFCPLLTKAPAWPLTPIHAPRGSTIVAGMKPALMKENPVLDEDTAYGGSNGVVRRSGSGTFLRIAATMRVASFRLPMAYAECHHNVTVV